MKMSDAACKAAICDDKAQGLMETACNKIYSIKGAANELRIKHAEIYIKYMLAAEKAADKVVMESGE